jgi:hypothetical protein
VLAQLDKATNDALLKDAMTKSTTTTGGGGTKLPDKDKEVVKVINNKNKVVFKR